MIKKNTKVIFEDGNNKTTDEMIGGIPLSKGEMITVHKDGKAVHYEVADKVVDCYYEDQDQIVDITYIIKKKIN
ncbi:MAG: hypothetical protein WCT27_04025 [Patescibacteria group bacterium]|jgi:hypothetical protein